MFKPSMRELMLIPKIGSLELYTLVPIGTQGTGPVSSFYWRDNRVPKGRGPFISLWDCMEDFKVTIADRKRLQPPPIPFKSAPGDKKIISVDFSTKKRL